MEKTQENQSIEKRQEDSKANVIEGIDEDKKDLSEYQIAAQVHPNKKHLPSQVFLNSEYINRRLIFYKIVKTAKKYFLTAYKNYAAEVEDNYYITFDYDGNQLDAKIVSTYAIDLEGEIVFNTDSTFQVNHITKNIEWEDDDIIEVGEPKRDTVFYTITNKGKFIKNN